MSDAFVGTGTLVRFALRRSRFALLWWILGTTVLYPVTVLSLDSTYPTQQELDTVGAAVSGNPALIAMAGPDLALNTLGGQVAWQTTAFGAILAGLMSTFLIVRHTRGGEEGGQDELLRADVVGRAAGPTAALIVAAAANLVLLVTIALTVSASGLPAVGSWALGVACASTGLVFTGFALVFCQISSTTRGAWGMSGAALGIAYLLRAVGDVGNGVASWLSPIGWGQQIRAFADERWWPVLVSLGATVVLVLAARLLYQRRDFGAGLRPARRGPVTRGWRGGAYELAWRLQRPTVIGWIIGLAVGGAAYGSIGDQVGDLVGEGGLSGALTGGESGGEALVDGFYGTAILMLAILAAAFGVSCALRARGEETSGRVEPLLATALRRSTFLASHTLLALASATVAIAVGGAATGFVYGVIADGDGRAGELTVAGLAYAPAIWVMVGLAVAISGVLPRFASLAWVGIVFAAVMLFFGSTLDLPAWLIDVSPFSHVPLMPLEDFAWPPTLWLTGVAVALLAVGFAGFRHRDVMN